MCVCFTIIIISLRTCLLFSLGSLLIDFVLILAYTFGNCVTNGIKIPFDSDATNCSLKAFEKRKNEAVKWASRTQVSFELKKVNHKNVQQELYRMVMLCVCMDFVYVPNRERELLKLKSHPLILFLFTTQFSEDFLFLLLHFGLVFGRWMVEDLIRTISTINKWLP